MSFKRVLLSVILSIALVVCVATAGSATTTYNYTGNNFTFAKKLITTAMSLSGSIELAAPLAPGLTNVDITPSLLSFSVADGVRVVTDANSLFAAEFRVSTDGLGNISDWAIYLNLSMSSVDRIKSCTGAFASAVGSGTGCALAVMDSTQFPVRNFGSVSNNPGIWSIPPSNSPPDCSAAASDLADLWPPDQGYELVSILGVTDPDGDEVTVTTTGVFQDEDVNGIGDGNTSPDGILLGGDSVKLRRERSGVDLDGRTYHVDFSADDGQGGVCTGSVTVCAPHNLSGAGCDDMGPLFDSLDTISCVP